ESLSLGGSLTLDTSDIGEHTSNKYFTDARAQATLSVASNSGHGALAYDNSSGQFSFAGITTEAIQDVVGAMFSSNTETAVTVNYQDSDGTIDLVVDDTTKVPLAGGTMTGNLTLGDNVNAYFGASTDLRIYHDGTNSHIINSTGELRFSGSNFAIKSDSAKLYLGAGDDLKIYHDGSHSYMTNTGGSLYIRSTSSIQLETDGGVDMLTLGVGGAATLFHNGSAKLATTSGGVNISGTLTTSDHIYLPDSKVLYIGAAPALALYHTGTNSHIQNSTGALINTTATFVVNNAANTETMLNAYENGAVGLYYDGSVKLATTSTGVQTTGTLNVNGAYSFPTSDGTNGQVLQTDGSGNLTFVTGGGGAGDITAVVAGTNLTGGATSGSATVNLAGSLTSISKITFTNSNVQAPTTSDATTGARLVLYSNGSGRDYSIGIESNTMWFNSDADYKWYRDGNPRMLLNDDVLTFYTSSNNPRGYISATETNDGHFVIATSNGEDIAFRDNGIGGDTNFLIRGDGTLYQGPGTNLIWHAGNDGTGSGLDADTVDGIQALSFLRSDTNDSVGTDVRHDYGPNSTWSSTLRIGGNGYTAGQNNTLASVVTTNGNLHLDAGGNRATYINHYAGTGGVAFGSGSSGAVAWMGPDGDLWKGSADNTGSKYWHAGNDGSGSGLDADLLDGLSSEDFARLGNYSSTFGGTPSGSNRVVFQNASGQSMNSTSGYLSRLECLQGTAGADAFMTFHVSGDYAVYFGLDGATNDLSVGGWSMGATKYKVWHAGNDGPNSGLYSEYNKTLVGQGGISNAVGTSNVEYSGQISSGTTGLFNASNNANGILRLNTHPGNYYHDLGFSSDGNMYHRNFSNSNAFTTAAWYKVWDASNDGPGSGLDADTLDGLQGSSYMGYLGMATNRDDYINLRVIRNSGSSAGSNGMYIGYGNAGSGATRIYGGGSTSAYFQHDGSNLSFVNTGLGAVNMSGALTITSTSIRSNASSSWDGNPGAQGKIQYHSNRWYIVADQSSNRIVQFRRNGSDVSYIDNSGNFVGNVTGTLGGISTANL
ncbi:MAG: hypothetical protein VXY93_08070, partial [Pseudomonadota bacterium]|nr:hypothetical protein [Pseudomonadota bacterium]